MDLSYHNQAFLNFFKKDIHKSETCKWILLDSSIYIDMAESSESYNEFLNIIEEAGVDILDTALIKFEALRLDTNKSIKQKKLARQYIFDLLGAVELSIDQQTIYDALQIAKIHSVEGHNSASVVDCTLGAQLKKKPKSMFLATIDNKDFPTFLWDRVLTYPIEFENQVKVIGFYQFNSTKWNAYAEIARVDKI